MGVSRYTTRLLGLVCLFGDLGGEGGGRGGVPSFGCGEGEFGKGSGPKNWRGYGGVWMEEVMGFYEFGIGKGWIGVFEMVLRAG